MGLFDWLQGKKETPHRIRLDVMAYYAHSPAAGQKQMTWYDPEGAQADLRTRYPHGRLLTVQFEPSGCDAEGIPQEPNRRYFESEEDTWVKALLAENAAVRIAGRRYARMQAQLLVYGEDNTRMQAWVEKLAARMVPRQFHITETDWSVFLNEFWPSAAVQQQQQNEIQIARLKQSGKNPDAVHRLEFSFTGSKGSLEALRTALEKDFFGLIRMETDRMHLYRFAPLLPPFIERLTQSVLRQAEACGAQSQGWEAQPAAPGNIQGNGQDGYCILTTAEGNVYEGEMTGGYRNGQGTLYFKNGDVHRGQFQQGERTGEAHYRYDDGEYYEGAFVKGQRQGYGKFVWNNGNIYEGHWVQNSRSGTGVLYWSSQDMYTGEWKDDKRHGKGRIDYVTGEYFEGMFEANALTGPGFDFNVALGEGWEGMFQNGDRVGEGRILRPYTVYQQRRASTTWKVLYPGAQSLPALLRQEAQQAWKAGKKPILFLWAPWAPPARKFKAAMFAPDLAAALKDVVILQLNDGSMETLAELAPDARSVPMFWPLHSDGRPLLPGITGAIWGNDTEENISRVMRTWFLKTHDFTPLTHTQACCETCYAWLDTSENACNTCKQTIVKPRYLSEEERRALPVSQCEHCGKDHPAAAVYCCHCATPPATHGHRAPSG